MTAGPFTFLTITVQPDPWSSLPDPVSETSLPDPWQSGSQASRPAGNVKPKQRARVSVEPGGRLLAASTQKVKLNKFEQAGSDVEKIKQRRAQGCPRKGCTLEGCQAGAIPFLDLKTLCPAPRRGCIFCSLHRAVCQREASFAAGVLHWQHARLFCIFLQEACHICTTMRKYFAGQPDMRKQLGSAKKASYTYETAQATQACNNFFLELYQSAAEALPEDDKCAALGENLACRTLTPVIH